VDVDFPGTSIKAYPNPFRGQFTVRNLQPLKSYIVSLHNMQGRLMYRKRVVNRQSLDVNEPSLAPGMYLLSILDEKKGKLLGSVKLVNY
jgi:hypothetical protein